MWLIHTVGKCGKNWKIARWIPSPLPTKNAIKHVHICLPENPNKARTQLWNLAFFFLTWSNVCPIFHCQNMLWESFIWVISFQNTVIEVSWLTLISLPVLLHVFSFLAQVCASVDVSLAQNIAMMTPFFRRGVKCVCFNRSYGKLSNWGSLILVFWELSKNYYFILIV